MTARLWVRKLLGLFLIVGLIVPMVTACGSSKKAADTTKPSEPAATPAQEKMVRITFANAPLIDPGVGSDEAGSAALANLYDTLVFPQDDGSVAPHLATSWKASDDGLTYTFAIKSGVRFHNGDELTAEDVVFSMQRMQTIGEGYGYLFTSSVASAKALDKNTVQFTLKKTFGPFVPSLVRLYILNKKQVMANIQKQGSYGDKGDYGKQWLLTHDAGSGPYMVKEMKQGEYLLAQKFPDYWAGFDKNNPDSFKIIGLTEPVTVRTMLSRKELEITDQYQPMENYQAFEKMSGVEVATLFTGNIMSLTLHNRKPPTDDIHFRKALAYAVDYDTIINKIFPGSRQSIGPVPFVLPGHNKNLFKFTHDLTKAQEELKQSKYYGQLDKYPVELDWIAETPDREKIALLIQAEAAKIGIKVNVVKVPWLSLVENVGKPESTPHAATIAVAPHYAEAGSVLESRFHSKSVGTWEQTEWLKNPEIDAMIDDAISTVNRDERLKKYEKVQEKIVELAPSIPLFDQPEKHAYQSAYLSWRSAENAKAGRAVNPVLGYVYYMRDVKVFPEKMK